MLEADASSAPQILGAVQELELPLVLAFNRSRVMLLPQGISKATGLRAALDTLRLSLHNCIAIGDAENDFQMLEAVRDWRRGRLGKQIAAADCGRGFAGERAGRRSWLYSQGHWGTQGCRSIAWIVVTCF